MFFFKQIMHTMTFHINNPSDAKLASLSILKKNGLFPRQPFKNRKIQKVQYLSTHLSYFHNFIFWISCVRAISIQRGHDLEVPKSINCKIKDLT